MQAVIYGIPSCDSIRKARKWFDAHQVEYRFVDVRETPPSRAQVEQWADAVGHKALINKRSTTWKDMNDGQREEAESGDSIAVLIANPTLIKRPVLEYSGHTRVGFDADD